MFQGILERHPGHDESTHHRGLLGPLCGPDPGIPLKIKECGDYPGDAKIQPAPVGSCNAASVDSELSMLGLFTPQISGVLNNPVCNNASRSVFNPQPPPRCFLWEGSTHLPSMP